MPAIPSQLAFILLVICFALTHASELMFELPDNEKMCFHEIINKGVKCSLEFQASLMLHEIDFVEVGAEIS
jgi:hypothetical protein